MESERFKSARRTSGAGIFFALLLALALVAACNPTGLPIGGSPVPASTSTTVHVVEATPTLIEFMPGDTATPTDAKVPLNTPTSAASAGSTAIPVSTVQGSESPSPRPTRTTLPVGSPTATILPETDRVRLFNSVWDVVNENYLYEDFNGVDWEAIHDKYEPLVRGAGTSADFYTLVNDMVRELKDEHSRYLSPEEAREEDALRGGNADYVGIGVISSADETSLGVIFVFPGSPAEKAGLKRRDRIMAVDGEPLVDPANAPSRIRGPEGTTVRLTVKSPGRAEREVAIVRGRVTGAMVPTSSRLEADPRIGYLIVPGLRTEDMGTRVAEELESMLQQSEPLDGLVMDLRGNGGGFRTSLISILSDFVSGRVGTFFNRQSQSPFNITGSSLRPRLEKLPVVVLVDEGTASYGEVLAAILQDKGRATVVGVASAGNTETIYSYDFDDGSRLWSAQEGFRLPDGTDLEGRGVVPDHVLDVDWLSYTERDDPHILKAVEVLAGQ